METREVRVALSKGLCPVVVPVFSRKKSKLHTLVRFILKRTLASCCSSISQKRKSKQVPKPVASYQDFYHLLFRPFLEKIETLYQGYVIK